MAGPRTEPIGLQVIGTGRLVAQAFDDALAEVDGSLHEWLALVSLKAQHHSMHADLADAAPTDGPAAADRLEWLRAEGLVQRSDGHRVELTAEGQLRFNRLLKVVVAFDRRLRADMTDEEGAALDGLLARLRRNVKGGAEQAPYRPNP